MNHTEANKQALAVLTAILGMQCGVKPISTTSAEKLFERCRQNYLYGDGVIKLLPNLHPEVYAHIEASPLWSQVVDNSLRLFNVDIDALFRSYRKASMAGGEVVLPLSVVVRVADLKDLAANFKPMFAIRRGGENHWEVHGTYTGQAIPEPIEEERVRILNQTIRRLEEELQDANSHITTLKEELATAYSVAIQQGFQS